MAALKYKTVANFITKGYAHFSIRYITKILQTSNIRFLAELQTNLFKNKLVIKILNFDQLFPFVHLPKSKYFLIPFKLKYTFEQSYKTEQLWRACILLRFWQYLVFTLQKYRVGGPLPLFSIQNIRRRPKWPSILTSDS